MHAKAAAQACEFGDQQRESKERRLQAAEALNAWTEDERAELIARQLEARPE